MKVYAMTHVFIWCVSGLEDTLRDYEIFNLKIKILKYKTEIFSQTIGLFHPTDSLNLLQL